MNALTLLRELIERVPAEGMVHCSLVREALAEVDTSPTPSERPGTGPGGDFTHADLKARLRRGGTWVREHANAGDFGEGYRHGRERVFHRADVLAYEARLRGDEPGGEVEVPRARSTSRPLSLPERRRLA